MIITSHQRIGLDHRRSDTGDVIYINNVILIVNLIANFLHFHCFKNDFWASEVSSMLGSLRSTILKLPIRSRSITAVCIRESVHMCKKLISSSLGFIFITLQSSELIPTSFSRYSRVSLSLHLFTLQSSEF